VAAGGCSGEAVARVGQDNKEGKGIMGMEKTTRGSTESRRWTTVICRGQRGFRGRRREGEGPGDCFVKTKNFRDPTEKKNFPLI
jgi:hypothetical protein